jgi:hypothetical protein
MKRPFFVATPRNRYGEDLCGPSIHQPPYTIQNCLEATVSPRKDYASSKNRTALDAVCKEMNDQHEVEMAMNI